MENQTELEETIQEQAEIIGEEDLDEEGTYVADDDGEQFKIQMSNLERRKKHSRGMMDVSKKVSHMADP